jgi:vacuolar iron transporter family protein
MAVRTCRDPATEVTALGAMHANRVRGSAGDTVEQAPPLGEGVTTEAAEHIGVTRARVAARSRVREVIFGTQDGLLTTLGLVSVVGAATVTRYTILVAGLAGSLAGMIAMGAGAYISSKSQLDVAEAEVERESRELRANPEREFEELVQLFEEEGLPDSDARVVAEKIAQRPSAMLNAMTQKELGISLATHDPLREGLVMAAAFLVGAVVPLAPWFFAGTDHVVTIGLLDVSPALLLSVSATILLLFGMGWGKARIAHQNRVRSAFEIVAIGLAAAVTGYVIGTLLPRILGASA